MKTAASFGLTVMLLLASYTTQLVSAQILSEDLELEIGAGALVRQEYPGSDSYSVLPIPYIDINYKDRIRVLGDSIRFSAFTWNGLHVGAVGEFDFGRDEDDDTILRGLGDIDPTVELGIFADYLWKEFLIVQTSFRHAVSGHESFIGDAGIFFQNRVGKFSYRIGPEVTFSTDDYVQEYYGITPAQSARSGLPVYDPDGGFVDVGITLTTKYQINEKWGVVGFASVDFLLEEVTDSPLAEEDISPTVGLFFSYKIQ